MSILGYLNRLVTLGRGLALGINEGSAREDPMKLFDEWFRAAQQSSLMEPTAMTLATCAGDGRPAARMVLLKGHDDRGFLFFTNYGSRKADELDRNGRAALVFYWQPLLRQVRIEGTVKRISKEESWEYFRTRALGSRIGAWASRQSEPLASRSLLEERVKRYTKQFPDGDVPLPEFWGGYRVQPHLIEFWQGRANRLHDRLLFQREREGWKTDWLYP